MRRKLLKKLIEGVTSENIYAIKKELDKYNFDVETPIVKITEFNIRTFLKSSIIDYDKFSEYIEDWANIIESRDDLYFESEKVFKIINALANPVLYGESDQKTNPKIHSLRIT